jgi:hypothetical protein
MERTSSPRGGKGFRGTSDFSDEHPFNRTLGDGLSGRGEVNAAFLVGQCVANQGIKFSVISSAMMRKSMFHLRRHTLNDFELLVFLGNSVSNNPLDLLRNLGEWKSRQNYHFDQLPDGRVALFGGPPGEISEEKWVSDMPISVGSGATTTDYALVSYLRTEAQIVICLAGNGTDGDYAAAMALCDPHWADQFVIAAGLTPDGMIPEFEAVLKVTMTDGFMTQSTVVSKNIHQPISSARMRAKRRA